MERLAMILAAGAMTLTLAPTTANAWGGTTHYFNMGEANTGFNRALGVPQFVYPHMQNLVDAGFPPVVLIAGFRTQGEYDPLLGEGGGNSIPYTPAVSMDSLVATHYDTQFMPLAGTPFPTNPVLNVHIDNVAVLVDFHGIERAHIQCADESSEASDIVRNYPCYSDGLTLGEWMQAAGFSHIECRDDGTGRLRVWDWNMRPNRLYTGWLVLEDAFDDVQNPEVLNAIPFGGVPNSASTNKWGTRHVERELGYCPHEREDALGYVSAFRSNGQSHGGVPVPFLNGQEPDPFEPYDGLFPGGSIHVQLGYNINGVPFDPANPPF